MSAIDLLLQNLSNSVGWWLEKHLRDIDEWVEEHARAFDKLIDDSAMTLWEWLEDLGRWFSTYVQMDQESHHTHAKDLSTKLSKAIGVHHQCWDGQSSKAEMWLDHMNVSLDQWLEEAPLIFYEALENQDSRTSISLQEYTDIHKQHLEVHVEILEQLWDNNFTASSSQWLTGHVAASPKYPQPLLHVVSHVRKVGRAHVAALQDKWLGAIKWLEDRVDALEQWLGDTIRGHHQRKAQL